MSASLVGSEMCIRDRDCAYAQHPGGKRRRGDNPRQCEATMPRNRLESACLLYTSDAADDM
eukprot:10208414-Alexandrium_andersonii.AAC.1